MANGETWMTNTGRNGGRVSVLRAIVVFALFIVVWICICGWCCRCSETRWNTNTTANTWVLATKKNGKMAKRNIHRKKLNRCTKYTAYSRQKIRIIATVLNKKIFYDYTIFCTIFRNSQSPALFGAIWIEVGHRITSISDCKARLSIHSFRFLVEIIRILKMTPWNISIFRSDVHFITRLEATWIELKIYARVCKI